MKKSPILILFVQLQSTNKTSFTACEVNNISKTFPTHYQHSYAKNYIAYLCSAVLAQKYATQLSGKMGDQYHELQHSLSQSIILDSPVGSFRFQPKTTAQSQIESKKL